MKIGFIGSGNMALSIVSGMLTHNFSARDIYLSDIDANLLQKRQQELQVNIATNKEIAQSCEVIFLAVKPQVIDEVCRELQVQKHAIIVSIMAGITTNKLQQLLHTTNIIRTMPNTPAQVGFGATGIFSLVGKNNIIEKIFNSIGVCVWVEKEEDIDSITALSGSGPAYFYLMFEAMINSAITMGLSENDAKKLCLQTAMGAAIMGKNANLSQLRTNVTSKGGTTAAALAEFEHNNFTAIIENAMMAAKNRAYELSTNL